MDEVNNDPFSLSEDELVERLENLGIENARTMDVNDRVILFLQLMGEAEAPPLQSAVASQTAPNTSSRSSAVSASATSASSGGRQTDELPSTTSQSGHGSANGNDGVHDDDVVVMGSDARQYDEAVASLCSITGTDEESARHLLEALGWDLNAAIAMYMEQEGSYRKNKLTSLSGQPDNTSSQYSLLLIAHFLVC